MRSDKVDGIVAWRRAGVKWQSNLENPMPALSWNPFSALWRLLIEEFEHGRSSFRIGDERGVMIDQK